MRQNQTNRAGRLRDWLVEDALPLWSSRGVDREAGGFFEKLGHDLVPVEAPRRARLVARQIYCFALGAELGWPGPARELVRHGLDFLLGRLVREDGTVLMTTSPDGATPPEGHDPYDYAFVLLGLATAARQFADRAEMLGIARKVRDRLIEGWSHPRGGFEQSMPRSLPLMANPQMHLLEAFLAWAELATDDPRWGEQADALAGLALERLIDPVTGALPEYFDGEWRPLPDAQGLLVEPGHQFEWSWLLGRWAQLRNDRRAFSAAGRLAELGERFGLDARGSVINALDGRLQPRDTDAKLWPQTERAKAWHGLAVHPMQSPGGRQRALRNLEPATTGIEAFLMPQHPGLWREVRLSDGSFVDEPVRASSLYHLTCAIHTLHEPAAAARCAS